MKRFKKGLIVSLTTLTIASLGVNAVPSLLWDGGVVVEAATEGIFPSINAQGANNGGTQSVDVKPGNTYTLTISSTRQDNGKGSAIHFSASSRGATNPKLEGTTTLTLDGSTTGPKTASMTFTVPAEYSGSSINLTRSFTMGSETSQDTQLLWDEQKFSINPAPPEVTTGVVNINYVDEEGNILFTKTPLTGNVGDAYHSVAEPTYTTDDGTVYELDNSQIPANADGQFTAEPITVNYIYKKVVTSPVVTESTVTTKYVDVNGKEIKESVTTKGKVNEAYKTTAPSTLTSTNGKIYELTETPANAQGVYTEEAITVTYVYKEQVVTPPVATESTVTTKYVDANGKELKKAVTTTGTIGETYLTEAPKTLTVDKIEYVLDTAKLPTNAEGKYTEDPITVTYVYKEKAKGATTTKEDPKTVVKTTTTTKKTLPKTGESRALLSSVLGTIILAASAVVVFFKKKKA